VFTLGGRVQHAYRLRLTREATCICLLGAGLLLASLAPAAAQDPHAEIFTGLDQQSPLLGQNYVRFDMRISGKMVTRLRTPLPTAVAPPRPAPPPVRNEEDGIDTRQTI